MTVAGRSETRPAADPAPRPGRRAGDTRRWTFLGLSVPVAVMLVLFIVAPIVLMVTMSLREKLTRDLLAPFPVTFEHYERVAAVPAYFQLLQVSVVMAFLVAVIATALAYPIAYFLAFRAGSRASLYLILLLVPFWTSYLLRVMAWKVLLGASGAINTFLLGTGLIDDPLSALLYNRPAVVMTLVYVWIPFAALPILAVLGRIDVRMHDAAADLYASPFQQFRRVTLPLSAPGIVAAFLMVFIPTIGEYVTPLLVGGNAGIMYGNTIEDFFTKAANWPLGSALSVIMLAVTLVLVVVGFRVVQPRRFLSS